MLSNRGSGILSQVNWEKCFFAPTTSDDCVQSDPRALEEVLPCKGNTLALSSLDWPAVHVGWFRLIKEGTLPLRLLEEHIVEDISAGKQIALVSDNDDTAIQAVLGRSYATEGVTRVIKVSRLSGFVP
mmetsp:Transcript_68564/g.165818  ORF Transcript_68564/g.165818 Transcript_68564/m.165818 type:complete len:128 (-) Transcript_68564:1036-1419(-)